MEFWRKRVRLRVNLLQRAGIPRRRVIAGCRCGIATLALCANACLSTDRLVDPDSLTLDFTIVDSGVGGAEPGYAPEVEGGRGTITVRAVILTPECGWTWDAELTRRPEGYRLTLNDDFVGGIAVACFYRYRATVGGLPPRVYSIEVVHGNGEPVIVESVHVN